MSVHNALLVLDGERYWFAATDDTGPDHFLPVNRPCHTNADEAEVARLFDVQPGSDGSPGMIYMRVHRRWLAEKGATFLTPDKARAWPASPE